MTEGVLEWHAATSALAAALPAERQELLCMANMQRLWPFHVRVVAEHPQWRPLTMLIRQALAMGWSRFDPSRPRKFGVEASELADRLLAEAPVLAETEGYDATWQLAKLLSELLDHRECRPPSQFHAWFLFCVYNALDSYCLAMRDGRRWLGMIDWLEDPALFPASILDREAQVLHRHMYWLRSSRSDSRLARRLCTDSQREGHELLRQVEVWRIRHGALPAGMGMWGPPQGVLKPMQLWELVDVRALALPVRRQVLLRAASIQQLLPFHMRFVEQRPEWASATPVLLEALGALWDEGAGLLDPESGRAVNARQVAYALNPVDSDGYPLEIEGIEATARALDLLSRDLSEEEEGLTVEALRVFEILARNTPLADRVRARALDANLRHVSWLEGDDDDAAIGSRLRDDAVREGEAMFRMMKE